MIDVIAQTWIFTMSALGAYMISRTDKWHRWGFVLCLASQPAWMVSTFLAAQWGIFALSFYYTWVWYSGVVGRFTLPWSGIIPAKDHA